MQLTHGTLTIAVWLTMISAFASIPMAYLVFKLEGHTDSTGTLMLGKYYVFLPATGFLSTVLNVALDLQNLEQNHDPILQFRMYQKYHALQM